jgi:hypothetical protein
VHTVQLFHSLTGTQEFAVQPERFNFVVSKENLLTGDILLLPLPTFMAWSLKYYYYYFYAVFVIFTVC